MVDNLRIKGSLRNFIDVCDVSLVGHSSMNLKKVCVALGLLIMESLARSPGRIGCTYSTKVTTHNPSKKKPITMTRWKPFGN